MCVFAKQNVAADPPFSRLDLISCRNLLIYLAPPLQKRVLPTFHYALNPNGYLVLGASETVGSFTDLFGPIDAKHRIYAKKASALRPYPHFNVEDFHAGAAGRTRAVSLPSPAPQEWQREADRLVLSQYAPAGVLVNDNLDVLHFRGQTGAYLTPAPGEASFNVLKMAREGLFLALRDAVNECRQGQTEVRRQDVRVRSDGEIRQINLRVLPVKLAGASDCCFLILFENAASVGRSEARGTAGAAAPGAAILSPAGSGAGQRGWRDWLPGWLASPSPPAAPAPVQEADDQETQRLRQELTSTREYLQSIIEQQDASNEELKSAHEEVLSSNEELQSTNEELETAKEELQSVNEELTTINEQLQNRNADLSRLNDDVANLLSSANVPMVSVGVDLRIRRFTPSAGTLLNLLPSDVGRPIGNLKPAVDVADLETLIAAAIDSVQPQEREVHDPLGRWYALRVYPYRTADNKIDGAVVVLVDIDQVKSQAARLLQQASLIDLSQDAIFVRDGNGAITFWNKGAREMFGWSAEQARGKLCHAMLQTTLPDGAAIDLEGILRRTGHWEGELLHTRRDGGHIVVESRQVLKRDEQGAVVAVLAIDREITQRKQMQEDMEVMRRAMAEERRSAGAE